jgi:Tfp pilus assembly protein PilN
MKLTTSQIRLIGLAAKAGLNFYQDRTRNQTEKGELMPDTRAHWKGLANLYAGKIEEDRSTISKLKEKVNKLEQKITSYKSSLEKRDVEVP